MRAVTEVTRSECVSIQRLAAFCPVFVEKRSNLTKKCEKLSLGERGRRVDKFSNPLAGSAAPDSSTAGIEAEADAISESELREFLAADVLGVSADPEFKRKLQGRLWEIVQTRFQKKRRLTWMQRWRQRRVPPAGETDGAAKLKREPGPD
jgi:hypothetical protein